MVRSVPNSLIARSRRFVNFERCGHPRSTTHTKGEKSGAAQKKTESAQLTNSRSRCSWSPSWSHSGLANIEDRQGSYGSSTGRSPVLDVAQGVRLPAKYEIRFARGTARVTPWCEVDHRVVDWASRSPSRGSSN